ncbi:MAG: 5-formyltetrahydrofolate cyclo-ligase [Desulfobacterales bacterium]|nr:5-formyltetrahydrofolate cyclo-ligase [Desulfobacterales bacterium]
MDEILEKKREIRDEVAELLSAFSKKELKKINRDVEDRLFEFANFMESKIVLLYANRDCEVETQNIIKRCLAQKKLVALPLFDTEKMGFKLYKVDNPDTELVESSRGVLGPDTSVCKEVPTECIDIAVIPGIAFDEKGGRIGSGGKRYDKLIPSLPITTRKVALSLECQIFPQLPLKSQDKHVDIIITEKRIIYKI